MLVLHRFELVPEEHGLFLFGRNVHKRCLEIVIVGRVEAEEVAVLHCFAHEFIVIDSASAEGFLLIAHVFRLDFHAQASAHGHVAAELQRGGSENGVVGDGGDVRCHGDGGIEV